MKTPLVTQIEKLITERDELREALKYLWMDLDSNGEILVTDERRLEFINSVLKTTDGR